MIDIIYGLLVIIAVFKGLRRGLIVAVLSLLAFMLGLAAALRLSVIVAGYLGETTSISIRWLPFISFLLIFIGVAMIVRWIARLLEAASEAMALGMVNKLGGVLLYVVLYTFAFSVVMFYAAQIRLFNPQTFANSVTYPFIEPWGPYLIGKLGLFIPLFRDLFAQLTEFFGRFSH